MTGIEPGPLAWIKFDSITLREGILILLRFIYIRVWNDQRNCPYIFIACNTNLTEEGPPDISSVSIRRLLVLRLHDFIFSILYFFHDFYSRD